MLHGERFLWNMDVRRSCVYTRDHEVRVVVVHLVLADRNEGAVMSKLVREV